MDLLATASGAFLLVFLAEFGDKSQLVCMALATRYRARSVVLAAVSAFALLNLIAVIFGSLVSGWLPRWLVLSVVVLLFFGFGIKALLGGAEEEQELPESSGKSVLLSVFSVIFLAEFGDKTQLTVAGLAASESWLAVWGGATLALAFTTILGVVAGRFIGRYISIVWMHRAAGCIFLLFACVALYELLPLLNL